MKTQSTTQINGNIKGFYAGQAKPMTSAQERKLNYLKRNYNVSFDIDRVKNSIVSASNLITRIELAIKKGEVKKRITTKSKESIKAVIYAVLVDNKNNKVALKKISGANQEVILEYARDKYDKSIELLTGNLDKAKAFREEVRNHFEEMESAVVEQKTLSLSDMEVAYASYEENVEKATNNSKLELLNMFNLKELKQLAKEKNIKGYSKMKKAELIDVLSF